MRRIKAIRIDFFGDLIDSIAEIDPLRGKVLRKLRQVTIFPGSHYVTPQDQLRRAIQSIREELAQRLPELQSQRKLLEAQRLEQRTNFDLEMLQEMGYCTGIENYSRHLDGRRPGEPPYTLLDYFPDDYLVFIDESHITIPQLNGMYWGDRTRKETLVEYGFRLPSALDNRPLSFEEFEARVHSGGLCFGDAGGLRDEEIQRSGDRADHPPHWPHRSPDQSQTGPLSGR